MVVSTSINRPWVAYVGPVAFPDGGAAARRILGNVLSLRQIGYDVLIGSGQLPPPGSSGIVFYKGIPIHSLSERIAENFPTLLHPYRWNFELAMRYYCPRAGHIIAISTYLEKYYRT